MDHIWDLMEEKKTYRIRYPAYKNSGRPEEGTANSFFYTFYSLINYVNNGFWEIKKFLGTINLFAICWAITEQELEKI